MPETTALTPRQLRDHTYPLLLAVTDRGTKGRRGFTYARPVGEDLIEFLAHRDGDDLRLLHDDEVATVGAAELFTLARERLRLLPFESSECVQQDGGEFHVLRGATELTAGKLVLLPDVLRSVLGVATETPAGLLVSVPTPHELVCAPVAGDLPATLLYLARYTLMTYEQSRRPLSPITYWWHEGVLTPVVTMGEDGMVDFLLPPAFLDAAS